MINAYSGRLIMFDEEDLFAKSVALCLIGLQTEKAKSAFGPFRNIAFEKVSEGEVRLSDGRGKEKAFQAKVAGLSFGPDRELLMAECGLVPWNRVIILKSWRERDPYPTPKRLFRCAISRPTVVFLRGSREQWRKAVSGPDHRRDSDARRVALFIVNDLLAGKGKVAVQTRTLRREGARSAARYFAHC